MKFVILILFLLLNACQNNPRLLTKVSLNKNMYVPLLTTQKWSKFSALQKITVRKGQNNMRFMIQIENEGKLNLVGLTPVLSRSFLITYGNDSLFKFVEHPFFKYPVRPENMLLDFQLAFAPRRKLQECLQNTGITLKTTETSRLFFSNQKLLIRIKYTDKNPWKAVLVFENLVKDYFLKIRTVEYQEL